MSSGSEIEEVLGISLDDLQWQSLALCGGTDTNMFYDDYESDPLTSLVVDQMCLSCPVMKVCLTQGMENGETGVWGGIFLTNGKMDKKKNSHKTEEVWVEVRDRISEDD